VLLDVRGQTTTPDSRRIREFVDVFRRAEKRPSHLAVVAKRDAMYGMARMLSAFTEAFEMRVTVHHDPEGALESLRRAL